MTSVTDSLMSSAVDCARRLADRFALSGFVPIDPPVLLPVDIFVELSGEDIRRQLFLVTDPSGEQLCLRPDFTLATARHYLNESDSGVRRYTYGGAAFHSAPIGEGPAALKEFYQAGIEIFGAEDAAAAEIEVIGLAVDAVRDMGLDHFALRLGDPGLFHAFLDELRLPDAVRRRLRRHFWRHDLSRDLAKILRGGSNGQEILSTALAGLDRVAATQLVREVLALAGIAPVGGRSVEDIVERFVERADLSSDVLSVELVDLIRDFLKIEGRPLEAHARISALTRDVAPGLEARIEQLGERMTALCACMADAAAVDMTLDMEFGRRLEYYTGLVFEISDPGNPHLQQIAGGGRYDDLLGHLGARTSVPAVGAAIYVNRLLAAVSNAVPRSENE